MDTLLNSTRRQTDLLRKCSQRMSEFLKVELHLLQFSVDCSSDQLSLRLHTLVDRTNRWTHGIWLHLFFRTFRAKLPLILWVKNKCRCLHHLTQLSDFWRNRWFRMVHTRNSHWQSSLGRKFLGLSQFFTSSYLLIFTLTHWQRAGWILALDFWNFKY